MSIFEHENYKDFLKKILAERGKKSHLADHLGCRKGFISQVINGEANFSLEHTMLIGEFLSLNQGEQDYLVLLVQLEKAGSVKLKDHFNGQIKAIQSTRQEIKSRITEQGVLKEEDRATYFSSPNFALVHMALSIPSLQDRAALAKKLKLSPNQLDDTISFLEEKGLITQSKDGSYQTGKTRIHLEKGSPTLNQHHTNTRVEVIKSFTAQKPSDLHYSGMFTIAKEDLKRVKDNLLKCIENNESILKSSSHEELMVLSLDMFSY